MSPSFSVTEKANRHIGIKFSPKITVQFYSNLHSFLKVLLSRVCGFGWLEQEWIATHVFPLCFATIA